MKNTRDQNGWIDFENEIRNIIIAVSEFSSYLTRKVGVYKKEEYYFLIDNEKSKLPLFLLYVVENKLYFLDEYLINDKWTKKDLEKLYKKIHDEIINFIRLFRCYISWINKFFMNQVQPKNIFENINITKILNFNYTDTFRKIYSNNLIDKDICWIHGRILDDGKGNIVMGSGSDFYDEKYEYFLDLFKFYQKYKYKTDMQYLKWAELNKENKIFNEIHIFGHSLDTTDADILKPFLESNRNIFIYCRNDQERYKFEKNILAILGKDLFLKKIRGEDKNIEFVYIEE